MSLNSESLIKVSTIKKSHAKQIQFVKYGNESKELFHAIHPETGDVNKAKVLGWAVGEFVHDLGHREASLIHHCYLVQTPLGLVWMNAPAKETELFEYYRTRVPQLFIS